MGVNFSPFEIGRRALRASQLGLTVAGQNIANVNTPGYSRQSVQLAASAPSGANLRLTGTGVDIVGVRSSRDFLLDSRIQTEGAIHSRLQAQSDSLAPVDSAFSEVAGGGIQTALINFFTAFTDLEAHPTSVPLRSVIVERANSLAAAFHSTYARLTDIRRDADKALRASVEEVNRLAADVARFNVQISMAENAGSNAYELRDQRAEAVRSLAELAGVHSVEAEDGSFTVTLGDGSAIVAGSVSFALSAESVPPSGLAVISLNGTEAVISDGRLRGLKEAIVTIGSQIDSLSSFAAAVASRVNTIHASGSDLDGNDGTQLFATPAGGVPVTAQNIEVAAAVRVNPRLVVAAARSAGTGDGTVARSLAALMTEPSTTIGTTTASMSGHYAAIVSNAGAVYRSAEDSLTTQQQILAQARAQRDAISGISLDEEAINLLQYQRAYEAAARFLRVADEMTQTILALGQ